MGDEIERKFLLEENGIDYTTSEFQSFYHRGLKQLKQDVLLRGKSIKQGYMTLIDGEELSNMLCLQVGFTPSEARLRDKSGRLYFTLKGNGGLSRNELETEVDKYYFNQFWNRTKSRRVEKVRLELPYQNHILEVDAYTDRDLLVAEIEVSSIKDAHSIIALGKDVSENSSYKNKHLAK